MTFVAARAIASDATSVRLELSNGQRIEIPSVAGIKNGAAGTLGFRPEHTTLGGNGQIRLTGTIDIIERLGESGFAHMRLTNGQAVIAEIRGSPAHAIDDTVRITLDGNHLHLFDKSGTAIR